MDSSEFAQFGWNLLTLSFFAIIISILAGFVAFAQQARELWKAQSADSLSTTFFAYFAAFYICILMYGISIGKIALIVAFIQFLPCLAIIWGIWKFKSITRNEYIVCVLFAVALVAMYFTEDKSVFMTSFVFGRSVFTVPQIIELWQVKQTGSLSIKMLLINETKSTFWCVYSWEINDMALFWPSLTLWGISAVIIAMWYYYRHQEKKCA